MEEASPLEVVHECCRCHATLTPEEAGQTVNISGMVKCKVCGEIGPLRVRIIDSRQKPALTGEPEA